MLCKTYIYYWKKSGGGIISFKTQIINETEIAKDFFYIEIK